MLLNADQEAIRDAVRALAQEQLWPHAPRWDREHSFPKEAHAGLAAFERSAASACPRENGGAALDYLTLALVLEEIAAGDGGTSTAISVTNCPRSMPSSCAMAMRSKSATGSSRSRRAACSAPSA